ncbi:MAG: aminoacyl-tRNA hydrolase [Peptococcaceae bacterium]|nr:aminoacyl-tRNA hydrolase [Peptococcaceae bacterium]
MFRFCRKGFNKVDKVVIGLGNPGREYALNRHNVGFLAIEHIATKFNVNFRSKFQSQIGECEIASLKIMLVKPQTFMNLSGRAVREILDWYKLQPDDIVIIHDDMDLPFGKIRLRAQGSPGGHNGIKSIIHEISTANFSRIKIGVGRPPDGWDAADYVLGNFPAAVLPELNSILETVVESVQDVLVNGIKTAMNKYNS